MQFENGSLLFLQVPSRLQPEISNDVTVSMETRDGYLLGFHNMHNKVVLLDLETPNKNCKYVYTRRKSLPITTAVNKQTNTNISI